MTSTMFTSFNARALGLKLSAEQTVSLAARYGFGGVDLMIRDAMEDNVDFLALKKRMDDLGLQAGAFPLPFEWRTTPEARFVNDLESLRTYAAAAEVLGLERTATWVMPEAPELLDASANPQRLWQSTFDFHVSRLHRIAKTLDVFGIRLGLEVIGVEASRTGRGVPFIHRLDQLEPLRVAVQSASGVPISVLIDSWHLYASGEPLSHAMAWGSSQIVWVHVADLPAGASPRRENMIDSIRGLPGEHGAVDSRGLLAELKAIPYDGPVTAEPLAHCQSLRGRSPEQVAELTARALAAIWPV